MEQNGIISAPPPKSTARSVERAAETAVSDRPITRPRRLGWLALLADERAVPIVVSLAFNLLLLTVLMLLSMSTDSARRSQRATIVVDTVIEKRLDLFDSPDWDVEPTLTLRETGGSLKSLAEDNRENSINDADREASALAALTGGQNRDGLASSQAAGDSILEGVGEGSAAGAGSADFFGAAAKGKSILYVIDYSFSMNEHNAMKFAVDELLRSMNSLSPFMEFQVIFYNHDSIMLELPGRGMVRATPANLERARQQILAVRPRGGTDHLKALRRAITLKPEIIMFLSDADEMLESDIQTITRLNQSRRKRTQPASIHVIHFHQGDGPPSTTGELLAQENNGVYKLIEMTKVAKARPR